MDFPFGIMDVATLLRLNIRRRGAGQVYADCPICGDRRGKLGISPEKNVWRCNYCGEGGGMLALYAKVYGISNSEAYREICDTLAADGFAPAHDAAGKSPSANMPEQAQAVKADAAEIHRTYSALLSLLTLTSAHREHLRAARGLTDEQIERFGFKSTPPSRMCRTLTERLKRMGCTIQGVPGFYINDYGKWTVKFYQRTSGIVIPIVAIDGQIQALQIRLDTPIKDANDPPEKCGTKYLPLSSAGKNMGTGTSSPVHFVGDPGAATVYVTEGALKADICHALTGKTFAATIGANNVAALDGLFAQLKRNGAQKIIEADDMDKFSNQMVNRGALKIRQMAADNGLACQRLVWNPNYKGIDDWLLARHRKEKKEQNSMNFKEMYLSGLCEFDHIDQCMRQWSHGPRNGTRLKDHLGLTDEEYELLNPKYPEDLLRDRLDQQRQKRCFRIYQLDLQGDRVIPFAFQGIEKLWEANFDQPPANEYRLVYDGYFYAPLEQTDTEILERVFSAFNDDLPKDYHGRSVSVSDVIELYGETGRSYYYCDRIGFKPVQFSPLLAKKGT